LNPTGALHELLVDLAAIPGMLAVVGSGETVAEMHSPGGLELELQGQWWKVESGNWHVHFKPGTVEGVQFVVATDDAHTVIPKLYYVRLADGVGDTMVRFYFPSPWLDDDERRTEFQPERVAQFEAVRDRYVGREGISAVTRNAPTSSAQ
jgi:hypothetical protein